MSDSAVIRRRIIGALSTLQQASASDTEGNSAAAARLYHCSACELEELRQHLPEEYSNALAQHVELARRRAAALDGDKGSAASTHGAFPQFPVAFQRCGTMTIDKFAAPQHTVVRPFWLMQIISRSIQDGAFVTPHLFVSKAVWQQDGANTVVTSLPQKVHFLSALCEAMEEMTAVSVGDATKLIRALATFLKHSEALRKAFDQETGRKAATAAAVPQRSRLERGFRELLHKSQTVIKSWRIQQDASYNAYLAWSVNIMEQAQLFRHWVHYFASADPNSQTTEVIEKLHSVAAFFYFGPCQLLLQDMILLVDRYNSLGRESLSRLVPVDIKLDADPAADHP